MTTNEISPQERLDKLVDSLELITARFLELTTANNQLASSQTPEIRKLFDSWLGLMSEEVLRIASKDGAADIDAASSQTGLAASSIVSLLLALHRRGEIKISRVEFSKGTGKNEDICDCLE